MPFLGLTVLQLLLAFISATILLKIVSEKYFLRRLASHKFTCWLAPTNQELTALKKGGQSGESKKGARQRNKAKGSPSPSKDDGAIFKILHNSDDLEWMADLALMSLINFLVTEFAFHWLSQANETNLSQLWLVLVLAYSVLNLWRLTRSYFANEQSAGERSICIVSACVFMFIAMLVLVVDENKLEFGLETAYKSFNETATAFIRNHTLTVSDPKAIRKPISFLLIKFTLAVLCALTGMVFTFPGFRYAQMHKQLFDNPETSNYVRYVTMFNFASPIMVLLLWVKPISRDLVSGPEKFLTTDAMFDSFRIYFIIIVNLVKFFTLPYYVSTFLGSVHSRIRRLRRRGGSTTNREIQLTVSSVYNYVNVVIIQYLLPILMCLSTVLLYKSLAGHSWLPHGSVDDLIGSGQNSTITPGASSISLPSSEGQFLSTGFDDATEPPKVITLKEIKEVFTYDVCQGVMGFATWWLHFSWFLNSLAGIVYHSYFMQ